MLAAGSFHRYHGILSSDAHCSPVLTIRILLQQYPVIEPAQIGQSRIWAGAESAQLMGKVGKEALNWRSALLPSLGASRPCIPASPDSHRLLCFVSPCPLPWVALTHFSLRPAMAAWYTRAELIGVLRGGGERFCPPNETPGLRGDSLPIPPCFHSEHARSPSLSCACPTTSR